MRACVYYVGHKPRCQSTRPNTTATELDEQSRGRIQKNCKRNLDSEKILDSKRTKNTKIILDSEKTENTKKILDFERTENTKRNLDDNQRDDLTSNIVDESVVIKCDKNLPEDPQSKVGPIPEDKEWNKEDTYSSTFSVIHSMIKSLISTGPALLRPLMKTVQESIVAETINQAPQNLAFDEPDADKENKPPVENKPSGEYKPSEENEPLEEYKPPGENRPCTGENKPLGENDITGVKKSSRGNKIPGENKPLGENDIPRVEKSLREIEIPGENKPLERPILAVPKLDFDCGKRRMLVPKGQILILSNRQLFFQEPKTNNNGLEHSVKKVRHSSEVVKTVLSELTVTDDLRTKLKQLRRSTRGEYIPKNYSVSLIQLQWYFELLEDPLVNRFLEADICRRYADKYLLAMVFAYFVRCQFEQNQINKMNFFAALYLAHDMEEDLEDLKYEVFPWALGNRWQHSFSKILQIRDDIFWKIDCRATVSRKCCEQVMDMAPHHWAWKRERPDYHGGAIKDHLRHPTDDGHPRGPNKSPLQCQKCLERICVESENSYIIYDSPEGLFTGSEKASDVDEDEDSGFQTLLCNQSDFVTSLLQAESIGTNKNSSPQKESELVRDCSSLPRATHKSVATDSDSSSGSDFSSVPLQTDEMRAVGNDLEEVTCSQADTVMLGCVASQEI